MRQKFLKKNITCNSEPNLVENLTPGQLIGHRYIEIEVTQITSKEDDRVSELLT